MPYSECLPTRLNPLAERTCFPQVGITSWAIRDPREQHDLDTTAKSFHGPEDCMRWLKRNGYECLEMTVDDVRKRWLPTAPPREIVRRIQDATRATGIPICGSLYHCPGPPGRLSAISVFLC